jgi:hypothetical protein
MVCYGLIPVTDRGGLYGCEMLRIPHCLDNRLTDSVRLSALRTGRALLPRNITCLLLVLISVTRLSKPHSLVRPKGLGQLKNFIHFIGSRTRDL